MTKRRRRRTGTKTKNKERKETHNAWDGVLWKLALQVRPYIIKAIFAGLLGHEEAYDLFFLVRVPKDKGLVFADRGMLAQVCVWSCHGFFVELGLAREAHVHVDN